ncbi:MAG TPA: TonB-dependent receptor [Acetobacteraceae bacterium]|nr:TonB-dependent receptor [Acetobacteraceae bacterium]
MKRACRIALAALAVPAVAAAQTAPSATSVPEVPEVNIVAPTPLLGSGVNPDTIPSETNVLTSGDLSRTGVPDLTGSLNQQVGGVNLSSASGNPYQPNLVYHGFEASPLQGTPQGLAVYVNGARFNQAFGDTVDWSLIPDIAINSMNLVGSNPAFGLNALGGAVNVQMKNGFTYHGFETDLSGGSFGTVQSEFQYGKQIGDTSTYVAGTVLHQGGWRDLQSSDIQNFYGDIGWRNDWEEVHLNITLAHSALNGPGTSPVELLAADPAAQFTGPNAIFDQYLDVNLNGNFQLTDTTSIQAVTYYDYFHEFVTNGNATDDTPCDDGSGLLCSSPGVYSTTLGGGTIPAFLGGNPLSYSELDNQTTNTNGYGVSAQVTNTDDVFGLANHAVGGLSFDGAQTEFGALSYVGGITDVSRVFVGPGIIIDEPGINQPASAAISDAYYGAFFTDTLNLTKRLAMTLSGRFNVADIDLADENGGDLTGDHSYSHFNPGAGFTYQLTPWLTAYAGYAVANRAPTPAELSCASPEDSCSLANFFVGDPNLKQVVAHTIETGLRGGFTPSLGSRLSYNIGLYRSNLDDDIVFVNSPTLDRAYFTNVGQTRRQGVDVGVQFQSRRWLVYLEYSYIDATYQSGFVESAGSNPDGDANGNETITPGDRLPGIPANQIKLGVYYKATPKWTVGAVGIAQTGQYLFGDEANLTPELPGFFTLNLTTNYQLTPKIALFATVDNVTDATYYTYGTFSPTTAVYLSQAPYATNPRSYSPAAPIGAIVGIRVTLG